MEKKIQELHKMIQEMFPESVSVKVFVNSEGIQVEPDYKTNLVGYSMKNIKGQWVNKVR